jgi:integrase/recombinase XerD
MHESEAPPTEEASFPHGETAVVTADPAIEHALARMDASKDLTANAVDVYFNTLGSENSRKTGRSSLRSVLRRLGQDPDTWRTAPWHRISVEALARLHRSMTEADANGLCPTPNTGKVAWSFVRSVVMTAYRLGQIPHERYRRLEMMLSVKIRGSTIAKGRMLSPEEINRLRDWCGKAPALYGAEAWAVLSLMLGGGLRREEVAKLTVDDLSDDARGVFVHGKGSKQAVQPIRPGVGAAIEAWLALRERHAEKRATVAPLTTNRMFLRIDHTNMRTVTDAPFTPWHVWELLSQVQRKAGVEHFSPHDLRRTYASTLLRTAPLPNVQRLMRHSDPRTTAMYDRRPMEEISEALVSLDAWWGPPAK